VPPGGAGGSLTNISSDASMPPPPPPGSNRIVHPHYRGEEKEADRTTFYTSTGAPTAAVGDEGGACSATTGNRIELLCSCGGQCLNPSVDHIGRCDVPCS